MTTPKHPAITDSSPRCCMRCGYNLRGLVEHRCPECGREFDPENPDTFLPACTMPAWALKYFYRKRWPLYAAWGSVVGSFIFSGIVFAPIFSGIMLWMFALILMTLAWTGFRWIRRFAMSRYHVSESVLADSDRMIRQAHVVMYTGLIFLFLPVSQALTFAIELPFLNRTAYGIYMRQPGKDQVSWHSCGPTRVVVTDVQSSGVYLRLGDVNFAYAVERPAPIRGNYWHLIGRWYVLPE